ncbi:hypothetical protein BJV74DRAFT_318879 [Russula compacta]|nr:hypothetical protein BJV74DRAFT_318879 [Russula compacta]
MDALPLVAIIASVSPSLAAYHYVKYNKNPLGPSQRCSKCGHLFLPGTSHTRILRSSATRKNKRHPTPGTPVVLCLRQTCVTCGHIDNNTLLNHHSRILGGNVTTPSPPSLPSIPHPAVTVMTPRAHSTDQHLLPDPPIPSSHLHPPTPPPSNPQSRQLTTRSKKSRPKHKAGLQKMLVRNKERQHEAANRGPSGLDTFLHSL